MAGRDCAGWCGRAAWWPVYVWDYASGMQLLRRFFDAAIALNPGIAHPRRGRPIPNHPRGQACRCVRRRRAWSTPTTGRSTCRWSSVISTTCGRRSSAEPVPAPAYVVSLDEPARTALRDRLRSSLTEEARTGPSGSPHARGRCEAGDQAPDLGRHVRGMRCHFWAEIVPAIGFGAEVGGALVRARPDARPATVRRPSRPRRPSTGFRRFRGSSRSWRGSARRSGCRPRGRPGATGARRSSREPDRRAAPRRQVRRSACRGAATSPGERPSVCPVQAIRHVVAPAAWRSSRSGRRATLCRRRHAMTITTRTGELDERFSSPDASPTPWSAVRDPLEGAETYWITTVRDDENLHTHCLWACGWTTRSGSARGGVSRRRATLSTTRTSWCPVGSSALLWPRRRVLGVRRADRRRATSPARPGGQQR